MIYQNRLSWANRIARAGWGVVQLVNLYRSLAHLLHSRGDGCCYACSVRKIGEGAHPYPSCKVWAPWNLVMGEHSCLAPYVDCYNVARIELGDFATVSQYAYLCGATHDYTRLAMPLVPKPIRIGASAWVAAGAFVGPGVTVEEGAVVGARACVVKDVPAWTVVAGNPARTIKPRVLEGDWIDSSTVGLGAP